MSLFDQPKSMRENLLPGSFVFTGTQKMAKPRVRLFDYTQRELKELEAAQIEDVLPYANREDSVTWVNIDGIHDVELFRNIEEYFKIHALAIEDILNTSTRPKFG